MRDFLLQNLVRVGDGYSWRVNINILKENIKVIEGFPCFPSNQTFSKPALFLAGENSNFIKSADIRHIERLFLTAEVMYIKNAGHWVHADNPQAFINSVQNFIRT